uniref:Uncharacterized protein n=1 Tax=Vespula pensylvanica TaxID=30213 RepID=A0A834PGA3_VESPE|nr:hypothetical protein H0235_001396 [Vespula pensylvanica]
MKNNDGPFETTQVEVSMALDRASRRPATDQPSCDSKIVPPKIWGRDAPMGPRDQARLQSISLHLDHKRCTAVVCTSTCCGVPKIYLTVEQRVRPLPIKFSDMWA